MKNLRMTLTAIALFAIVGSALAFKGFGTGNVYCSSTCASSDPLNIVIDDINGTATNPCGNNKYYIKVGTLCTQQNVGNHKFTLVDQ